MHKSRGGGPSGGVRRGGWDLLDPAPAPALEPEPVEEKPGTERKPRM
ncbi:hypothetical protein ACFW4K_15805 [Nocardiopsis alba]